MTKTGWNKKALQMSWITCMYQQEMPNISNTSHTKQVQSQTHRRCKICGHVAEREWCGAKRAIEYNKYTNSMASGQTHLYS